MSNNYSNRLGMGAIPFAGGVTFRVWAPHADEVSVAGSFNDWQPANTRLGAEGNGYWSADVVDCRPGDEYKFVLKTQNNNLWKIDPYARDVSSSAGNGIVYENNFVWTDAGYKTPPWHEAVIYEMHIGTFNDKPGGPPGNLEQALERLAYLQTLGINMIQLMPPMEFAGGFSWGYNPANIFAVESDYGTPNAMMRFINEAHRHGMGVIVDVVYNHFGPGDLDLWQFDGWSKNEMGGIYFYNDWRAKTPWGATRPDYGRNEVRQYLIDNALMWLEEYRADGLRWDATAYIRNVHGYNDDSGSAINEGWELMRQVNDEIDKRQPWKINIAEDMQNNVWITRETAAGGAGFDAQWSSLFVHAVREAVITQDDNSRNMFHVAYAIGQRYSADVFKRVIYTESHDEVANGKARLPEDIWPDHADSWYSKKRSTLAASLIFCSPGIPMLFQGQEFLEDGWFHDNDPLDLSKEQTFSGILQYYKDLIALRRNLAAKTRGLSGPHLNIFHINNQDKVIGFHRWNQGGPGDDVVIFLNFSSSNLSAYKVGMPYAVHWHLRLNSDSRYYDADFAEFSAHDLQAQAGEYDGLFANSLISIGAYSCLIYSR